MAESLDEQRHNLTHAVGDCILAWAGVEHAISILFAESMEGDHYHMVDTCNSVISLDARLAMISACLVSKSFDGDDRQWTEFSAKWKPMRQKIREQYVRRNGVAHSSLIQYHPKGVFKEFRIHEFTAVLGKIDDSTTLNVERLNHRRDSFLELSKTIFDLIYEVKAYTERPQESS